MVRRPGHVLTGSASPAPIRHANRGTTLAPSMNVGNASCTKGWPATRLCRGLSQSHRLRPRGCQPWPHQPKLRLLPRTGTSLPSRKSLLLPKDPSSNQLMEKCVCVYCHQGTIEELWLPCARLQGRTRTLRQVRLETTCVVQVHGKYSHDGQPVRCSRVRNTNKTQVLNRSTEETRALAQAALTPQERITHGGVVRQGEARDPRFPRDLYHRGTTFTLRTERDAATLLPTGLDKEHISI